MTVSFLGGLGEIGRNGAVIDGSGIGGIGHGALRDRRALAGDGVVVVFVTIDLGHGEVVTGPGVVTRGWVHAPSATDLIDGCADAVTKAVHELFTQAGTPDVEAVRRTVRRATGSFVDAATWRRPVIVPVIVEV